MKKVIYFMTLLMAFCLVSCEFEEGCGPEDEMVRLGGAGGTFYIDRFEASRTNATSMSTGLGVTRACNYRTTVPWGSVTYEDARNACLDAGKRLCTKDEWMAACGGEYPYGAHFRPGVCVSGEVESGVTGSRSECVSSDGVYDMSGNLSEWVEGGILMGGSYSSEKPGDLTCRTARVIPDPLGYVPSMADGFRCCADERLLGI